MNTYIIKEANTNCVKIGKTIDISSRLRTHQTSNSSDLLVLMLVAQDIEAQLHQQFKSAWVRGEWFTYTDDIKALVDAYSIQTQLLLEAQQKPVKRRKKTPRYAPTPDLPVEEPVLDSRYPVVDVENKSHLYAAINKQYWKEDKIGALLQLAVPAGMPQPKRYEDIHHAVQAEPLAVQHVFRTILQATQIQGSCDVKLPFIAFFSLSLGVNEETIMELLYRASCLCYRYYDHAPKLGPNTYKRNWGGMRFITMLSTQQPLATHITIGVNANALVKLKQEYPGSFD